MSDKRAERTRPRRWPRALTAFLHDVVMAAASFVVALLLRLGERAWAVLDVALLPTLGLFTLVCALVFWFTGLYRGVWRYASLNDMLAIARSVTLALLIFLPVTFLATRLEGFPRSVLIINWFVLAFFLSAPRVVYRVFKDRGLSHLLERNAHKRVPALLIGTGDAAETFVREMARDPEAPYQVLGLIDEKGTRVGRRIHGLTVLGRLDDLPRIVGEQAASGSPPQRLILSRRLERERMEQLLELADEAGMTLSRLPRLTELRQDDTEGFAPRPIAIEDLLGRTQAKLDRDAMRRLIAGRRVLVTGAGGSIGAELVHQVADIGPAELALLDNAETQLYMIDLELHERHPELPRRAILADIRDRARLEGVLGEFKPDMVFHAAALKHVPMVESDPGEGVHTNVIGTRILADVCRAAGAAGMVMVSTDKAVNPTNVMGATKRLAESYCQALDLAGRSGGGAIGGAGGGDGRAATRFVTVRFGNVLGSTGSVVPLFQRQMAAGGPLTVTHPDMTRYFMTVREAVELILQASAMGMEEGMEENGRDAGKITVLDMGEPVRIVDLARQMIRLAGLRPDKDIEIVFTGPRPGEKLYEEMFHDQEALLPTAHPRLRLAAPRTSNLELLTRGLDELGELARRNRVDELLRLLHRLVPEFQGPENRPESHPETHREDRPRDRAAAS